MVLLAGEALIFFFSWLLFAQVFRHLLNISVEFSAEEFETALLSPNDTLGDIHMPLLKVGAFLSLRCLNLN